MPSGVLPVARPSTQRPLAAVSRVMISTMRSARRSARSSWSGTTTVRICSRSRRPSMGPRSEEHTSELQSPCNLVCRLLLEKKKKMHIGILAQRCHEALQHPPAVLLNVAVNGNYERRHRILLDLQHEKSLLTVEHLYRLEDV